MLVLVVPFLVGASGGAENVIIKDAINADPTFCSENRPAYLPQANAIEAWQLVLQQDNLTPDQRMFCWWRIGSLNAYNFDVSEGETANMKAALDAFRKVWQLTPRLVCSETLNTATVFASIRGKGHIQRIIWSFRWLASIEDKDIQKSLWRVDSKGTVFGNLLKKLKEIKETNEAKVTRIRRLLSLSRRDMNRYIDGFVMYEQNIAQIVTVLNGIEKVAPAVLMTKWRNILDSRSKSE